MSDKIMQNFTNLKKISYDKQLFYFRNYYFWNTWKTYFESLSSTYSIWRLLDCMHNFTNITQKKFNCFTIVSKSRSISFE